MEWLTIAIIIPLWLYYIVVIRYSGFLTTEALFVYCQALMIAGTAPLLEPDRAADRMHAYILLYALIAFCIASALISLNHRESGVPGGAIKVRKRAQGHLIAIARPSVGVYFVVALSVFIIVAYFTTVGYSAFLLGVQNLLFTTENDIATLRLDSYGGSRYLFPGYVNQFKNALLPALTLVVVVYMASQRRSVPLRVVLILLSIFGLIGTGQRGALVVFVVTVCVYFYWQDRARFGKRFYKIIGLGLPIMIFATAALGRSSPIAGGGPVGSVLVYLGELKGRLLLSNQVSSVTGFRYVYEQPVQYGHEWYLSFVGLFPGNAGSDLSNRIFMQLYGSLRGTSPPSLWGSVYHNFGLVGILIAPIVLALIMAPITRYLVNQRSANTMQLIGVAGVATVLATWVAGSPTYLFNSGIAVYIFLWWWGKHLPNQDPVVNDEQEDQEVTGDLPKTKSQSLESAQ